MFESITESLQSVFNKLRLTGKLTERNIAEGLREVRTALLEADVNYKVVKDFVDRVTKRAVGQEVLKSVKPSQQIVKIVQDEIEALMSPADSTINYSTSAAPTVIMLAGLQGSGKTTTAGKFAKYLAERGKRPMLVAADVQRAAAIEQLKTLGRQIDIPVYSLDNENPVKICQMSLDAAKLRGCDTVILDTAGRLHVDEDLMRELEEIVKRTHPQEILLVCDAMTGQDAVNSAKEFNDRLEINGVILTKLDGDARGGAALSVRAVTGKPIKFVGVGEKLDKLEEFHPDRMASRILGMGDIVTLVEKAQETIDEEQAKKLEEKLLKNKFTLEDFREQLGQIRKMGSMKSLLSMVPGMGAQLKGVNFDDSQINRVEAVICSMTPHERNFPEAIDGSRKKRIAAGSGSTPQMINTLLKQFNEMKKMMKGVGKFAGAMGRMMPGSLGGKGLGIGVGRTKGQQKKKKRKKKRRR